MNQTITPIRSVLYAPGTNNRALEKGRELGCDAIIMDLEDSVSPEKKAEARENIFQALSVGGYHNKLVTIRINGLESEWGQADLDMVLSTNADAIVIPKVESAAIINDVAKQIKTNMKIWAMIETPIGVLKAQEIAEANDKLDCFVMGTSDLAKELRCSHTPERLPFLTSFGLCILAARANGLSILDGVYLDLSDDEGFKQMCRQAVELGFDGKTLIHPKTIEAANNAFAPTDKEVEEARVIITAHEDADKKGIGVVVVNGKLIENLHVEMANRLLQMDSLIRNK